MVGQDDRIIKTLEDVIRACIIDFKGNWDKYCLWWSLLIILVFIYPSPWLPMKPCMAGGVGILLDGLKWVRHHFFVLS